jgi:hypothetical protein
MGLDNLIGAFLATLSCKRSQKNGWKLKTTRQSKCVAVDSWQKIDKGGGASRNVFAAVGK